MPPNASPTEPQRTGGLRRWLPPVLAAVVVAMLAVALLRPSTGAESPLVGKSAPDFTLVTLDGQPFRLRAHLGQPVIVNFWASWCVPCRDEAPLLRDLAGRQTATGLAVVGVVFSDKNLGAVRQFVQDYALAYPSLLDPDLRTAINYGVSGVPETFFIDKGGVVRGYDQGGLTRERLAAGLDKIGVEF